MISLVTTLPAPITHPSQIVTGKIVEFDPIKTLSPIFVLNQLPTLPPSFPFLNRPGKPATVNYDFSEFWDVKEAVHAGPVLIRNGKIKVSTEQEVFFNTPVDGVQPRSAIGYKKNGDVIMMVVDGRQVDSRGVYLKELAMLLSQFDCEEAVNLDGGGSSSLVVNGKLVNKPIGLNIEREVMSCIAVFSGD